MKIYLNGPRSMRQQLLSHRETLVAMGCTVTSTWLDETEEPTTPKQTMEHIQNCVRDVHEADLTATFTGVEGDQDETLVYFGMSIGMGNKIAVIGPDTNLFHRSEGFKLDASFEDFCESLKTFISRKSQIEDIKQRVTDALKKALPGLAVVVGEEPANAADSVSSECQCEDCRKAREFSRRFAEAVGSTTSDPSESPTEITPKTGSEPSN